MLKVLWGHKKGHVPFCNETKFKFMSRWNWTTTWEKKAVNEVINIDLLKISFLSLKKKMPLSKCVRFDQDIYKAGIDFGLSILWRM